MQSGLSQSPIVTSSAITPPHSLREHKRPRCGIESVLPWGMLPTLVGSHQERCQVGRKAHTQHFFQACDIHWDWLQWSEHDFAENWQLSPRLTPVLSEKQSLLFSVLSHCRAGKIDEWADIPSFCIGDCETLFHGTRALALSQISHLDLTFPLSFMCATEPENIMIKGAVPGPGTYAPGVGINKFGKYCLSTLP